MVLPGPSEEELDAILSVGMRTPDHGKLAPWRFVVIGQDQRDNFAALLRTAYRAEKPAAGRLEIDAMDQFARQAPCLLAVISTPNIASAIPVWEQQLSAGAAVMNIEHAAHAAGYVAGWLTGWAAYSDAVLAALGGDADNGDRIAGFIFIGTPCRGLEERPRPSFDHVVSYWSGQTVGG